MANNDIQVVNVPTGTDVSLSLSGSGAKQIANAPGGIIEFISLDTTDKIPLGRIRFELSHYNLFVINGPITTNGSFSIPEEQWLENSQGMIPNGLTKKRLNEFMYYPAIIVRANENYKTAIKGSNAALALIFDPQVGCDKRSVKFTYIISELFPAQLLNEREQEFGILHSEQSNELDKVRWEIKKINVFKALGLEDKLCGKE